MAEQTILVRFHLDIDPREDDEDTRHNNRVWLQDQLSSRFDLDEFEFVDDPAEKVTQVAQEMRDLLSHGTEGVLAPNDLMLGQNSVASRVLYVLTDGEEG